jgi:hypothetical protein
MQKGVLAIGFMLDRLHYVSGIDGCSLAFFSLSFPFGGRPFEMYLNRAQID